MVERASNTWLYGSKNVTSVDYCTTDIIWRILDDDVDKTLKAGDVLIFPFL